MAPKAASTSTVGSLTDRDMKILASAIAQCLKNPVEVDYQKLADVVGLKNPNSAKASWHGVKKKLDAMQIDAGDTEGGETTANTGKKRKAEDGEEDDAAEGEAEEEATPEKKKKGKKAKKAAAADVEEGDEAPADAPKEKKKGGKKGKKAAAKVKEEAEGDDDA